MDTRFRTMLILVIAYTMPVMMGLAVTRDPMVLFGFAGLIGNSCVFWASYYNERTEEDVLKNAVLVLVLGGIFSVAIFMVGTSEVVWLVGVMTLASLIFTGSFRK